MVNEYKAAHTDFKYDVTFESMTEKEAPSAIRTDPSTGAHIYFFASSTLNQQVTSAALQPLTDEYVNKIKARDEAQAVETAKVGDKYYAFPNANSNGYFLIYDKNFYTEDEVKSLDTMVAKAKESGKNIIFDYNDGFYTPTFFFGMGVGLGDQGSGYANTLNTDMGYEAGRTYVKYFGTGKDGVFTNTGGSNNSIAEGFKAGSVVAGVLGTWVNEHNALYDMAENTEGWNKDRIGFAKLPMFTDTKDNEYQMGSFMGVKYCGVNPAKSEAEVEASLALADFFNTKESQIKRYLATGDAPTNIEAAKDERVQADRMLSALIAQNAAGGHMQLVVPSEFWESVKSFGENIYNGTTTSANIDAAVDALYAALSITSE